MGRELIVTGQVTKNVILEKSRNFTLAVSDALTFDRTLKF